VVHHLVTPMFLFTPDYPTKRPLREAVGEGLRELAAITRPSPKQTSIAGFCWRT